ncbi:MAG: DUF2256 and DUF3253 domain-containing protein [Pseudomonadota bacterium]
MAATPQDKICATCGRPFSWRRKWAKTWEQVRYCSAACRSQGKAGEREALERAILELLSSRRAGASCCPSEVARQRYPEDAWRAQMEPVRQAARRLAHRGEIEILQGGRAVDPSRFRGPIRLRLNSPAP